MKVDIFNTDKKYSLILADCPWRYEWSKGKEGGRFCPEKHYPTMTTDEIEIINLIRSAENPVKALLDAMELLIFLTTSNAKAEET